MSMNRSVRKIQVGVECFRLHGGVVLFDSRLGI